MRKNILKDKSFDLAIRTVGLYKDLCKSKGEYVLSKQILRSGTSVGAMVSESEYSESKNDFVHKLSIAQKELNETLFWLDLLHTTNYIEQTQYETIKENAIVL